MPKDTLHLKALTNTGQNMNNASNIQIFDTNSVHEINPIIYIILFEKTNDTI